MTKYVFNQDFEAKGYYPIDNNLTDQRSENLKHKFKKGDVFEGKKIAIGGGANPNFVQYAIEINSQFGNLKEDGSISMLKGIFQVPEDVVSEQTFFQKHKNHLLILGAIIIGYIAYKKYNK